MKVNIALFVCCIIALVYAYSKHMQAKDWEAKPNDTVTVHDTTWQIHDSIIIKKVPVIKEVIVEVKSRPEMLPDTNYDNLKRQYMALLQLYLNQKFYSDTLRISTFGYILVQDSVRENKLTNRRTRENYEIPIVKETKTITKYAPPTRNIYVGAGVMANNSLGIRGAQAGLIYKNKKDKLYQISTSVDLDGQVMYGASYFYKIK
jgi:hypothetical protein